ncbi:MAG: FKBP-type peptidyl-prolyl cis-trans isomerase [Isosphaeraceae bacterium]
MLKWEWGTGLVLLVGLVVSGCGEPPAIVPAAPPGVDPRIAFQKEPKEGEAAEALGESAGQVAGSAEPKTIPDLEPAPPTAKGEVKTTASGVSYETVKEGTGAVAKAGQRVVVHYTGTLEDGKKFDSSRDRGEPSTFSIGVGGVIKGWDEAVPGMKIGEVRKLKIPPNAGYGAQGQPPSIPPNATLLFEIELVDVK